MARVARPWFRFYVETFTDRNSSKEMTEEDAATVIEQLRFLRDTDLEPEVEPDDDGDAQPSLTDQ